MFGFGSITNVDVLNESTGIVPSSRFMNQRYGNFGWSKGAILNMYWSRRNIGYSNSSSKLY